MFSIELPEPTYRQMVLVPEPRSEKGGAFAAAQTTPPSSYINLAEPLTRTLRPTEVTDDKDLAAFLAATDGRYRYDYVRLGCSFEPRDGERFEKAWLKVDLKADGGDPALADEGPIAWSLSPLEVSQLVEKTSTVKFGSTAKLLGAGIESATKTTKKMYSVKGYREGKANPFWELYSNEAEALDGSARFSMVVRSPASVVTRCEVRLEAVISNRSYFIFREEKPFDDTPSAEIVLAAV